MSRTLADAVQYVSSAQTPVSSRQREVRALSWRRWSLEQIDLIRLAGIARRQALTHTGGCCTVHQRLRKGRAQAGNS